MKYFGAGLSEQHKELNHLLRKAGHLEEAKQAFLDLHAKLNMSIVSETQPNEVDQLFQGITREQYAVMPTKQDETIAWVVWHLARIEDLTMGILVGG